MKKIEKELREQIAKDKKAAKELNKVEFETPEQAEEYYSLCDRIYLNELNLKKLVK